MSSDDSSQRSKTFAKIGVGIYGAATNYALGKMGAPPRTPLSYLKPANLQMLRSAPPMVKLATGIGAAGLLALNKSLDK